MIRRCMQCETTLPPLVVVAVNPGNSAFGWDYYACRRCLVALRLIPFAHHPATGRGPVLHYPPEVPALVLARLAEFGEDERLTPLVRRLLAAAAQARGGCLTRGDRSAAKAELEAAVRELSAFARGGLRPAPEGAP